MMHEIIRRNSKFCKYDEWLKSVIRDEYVKLK